MKQIQLAVRERHEKELALKQSLEKANSVYLRFRAGVMEKRVGIHENEMQKFIKAKGDELQNKIVEEAKSELKKVENIRKVKERELHLKKIAEEKEKKAKADGTYSAPGEAEDGTGWGRGQVKQPQIASTDGPKKAATDEGGILSRGNMGSSKPEEKKFIAPATSADEGLRRPTFKKQEPKKEEGGAGLAFRSSAPTSAPKDDKPKAPEEKKEAPTSGPWRSSGPQ